MIESGLYRALVLDSGVNSLLPNPVGNNVYLMRMEKDSLTPAIVIQGISSTSINSLIGENQLQTKRFQFDCYAMSYFVARSLARAVKAVFIPSSDGFGFPQFPYSLPDGTQIQSAMVHMDIDWPFEEGEGGYLYRAMMDIEFGYVEVS